MKNKDIEKDILTVITASMDSIKKYMDAQVKCLANMIELLKNIQNSIDEKFIHSNRIN